MKQDQQRGLDSLRRVQRFLDTHAGVIGALGSSEGRKQLDAAVTALTELGTEQGTSDLRLAGQKHRERFITAVSECALLPGGPFGEMDAAQSRSP